MCESNLCLKEIDYNHPTQILKHSTKIIYLKFQAEVKNEQEII